MPGEKDTELRDQLADLCQAKDPDYDKIAQLISKAERTKVRYNELLLPICSSTENHVPWQFTNIHLLLVSFNR